MPILWSVSYIFINLHYVWRVSVSLFYAQADEACIENIKTMFNDMRRGARYTRCTHRLILDGSQHLLRLVFYRLVNTIPVIMKRHHSRRQPHLACLLFALAFAAATPAAADETVTLSRAIELAIANSTRMMIANEEIARARAEKGESWEPGNTTVSYAWGQLNGELKNDNELTVEQSLGSFVTPFYRNALVKTKVATGETQRELVRREITAEVKRAWTDCLYALAKRRLYDGQASTTETLKRICRLRYEQGDITKLEYSMMTTLAVEQQTQADLAEHEQQLAMKRLAWVCSSQTPLTPADTTLHVMATPLAARISQTHTHLFDLQARQRDDMVKVERSKFFPEFSVAYSRQKITPLTGLNSWTVGVSFPPLLHAAEKPPQTSEG